MATPSLNSLAKGSSIGGVMLEKVVNFHIECVIHSSQSKTLIELEWMGGFSIFEEFVSLFPGRFSLVGCIMAILHVWKIFLINKSVHLFFDILTEFSRIGSCLVYVGKHLLYRYDRHFNRKCFGRDLIKS